MKAFGGIDVLVLNGGGPPPGPAADITPEDVEAAVDLLLTPHVRLVGLCLPHLRASGRGRIVAIQSSSVKEPIANLALSNAVRPGVVGWLKTLSRELGPDGITVNTIAPGRIDTERLRGLYGPDGPPPELLQEMMRQIPAGRFGDPSEIAAAVCFLASAQAAYVSGTVATGRRRHAERARLDDAAHVGGAPRLGRGRRPRGRRAFLWLFPSRDYLYVPDAAQPVAGKVNVQGEKPESGPGAIYYVDVRVRRATWAERLVAFLRPDGATLVNGNQVVPPGSSFEERRDEGLAEMARSEQIAAAVALKEAGLRRQCRPTGRACRGRRVRRAGGEGDQGRRRHRPCARQAGAHA